MSDNWVTMKEACLLLDMSEATIRRHVKQGKLNSKVENGRRLILVQSGDQVTISMTGLVEELRAEVERLRAQLDDQNEQMKRKDEQIAEASQRHDTVVMQLTKIVEYQQQPFWRKLFQRKRLPPPVDAANMDVEIGRRGETDKN